MAGLNPAYIDKYASAVGEWIIRLVGKELSYSPAKLKRISPVLGPST